MAQKKCDDKITAIF